MGKQSKAQEAEQRRKYMEELRKKEEEKARRQNRLMWQIVLGALAIILIVTGVSLALSLGGKEKPDETTATPTVTLSEQEKNAPKMDALDFSSVSLDDCTDTETKTNYVRMNITYVDKNGVTQTGDVIVRLFAEVAPETVANFQDLVARDFYDGLTFHRVYKDFMIQGGDPEGNGSGDSGTTIKGEFNENGFQNNLKHVRGVLSMARGQSNNSASCQFFIMHAQEYKSLNGSYASFGYVVYGMDTVDGIANTAVVSNGSVFNPEISKPVTPPVINYMTFVEVDESAATTAPAA